MLNLWDKVRTYFQENFYRNHGLIDFFILCMDLIANLNEESE